MHQSTKTNWLSYQSLTRLFGQIAEEQLEKILSITEIIELDAGEYLFQQGESGHAFYIVLSGRFRALQNNEDGIFILGDISAGEPIGELSLFTKEKHSASIIALRKSSVLRLENHQYETLVQHFPSFANTITKFVIDRLSRNALQKKMDAAPKNIAVVNLQPSNDVSNYTSNIEQQLQLLGFEIKIYDHQSQSEDNYQETFDSMEKHAGLNFLVCDIDHLEWAKQCIAYCDLVIVASDFKAECSLYEIEKHLNLYTSNVMNKKIYLLLLHPENAPLPTTTRRWFTGRIFDLHLHIRKNNIADTRRVSRIITHQAIGLVLGGGGAKGFAHIGVLNALIEAGFEFDFVGGTSAGAIYGACVTHADFDMEQIMHLCKSAGNGKLTSNDYTLPFISLMTGKKIRRFLNNTFGDAHLEDFWVNTFCISTNFSDASLKVHESGLASQQIEASIAIPGVFPPVIIDRHLHIDGGIVDNLPIETMNKKPVRNIIAVSLSAEATSLIEEQEIPTAWKMFWSKFTRSQKTQLPGLSTILVNSITINSRHKQEASKSHVSLYLELDLKEFKFLDWTKWEQLIQKGYHQTKQHLDETPAHKQFWK